MHRLRSQTVSLVMAACCASATAADWPQWRGPAGDSTSSEQNLPLRWSESESIAWKTPLPQWGTSTPAIVGGAAYLTSEAEGKLLLLKLDTERGNIVWTREVGQGQARRKEPKGENRAAKFHDLHNLASPSCVCDGERVIAHFGNGELSSWTIDGRREWSRNLARDHGDYTIWWGHANSPVFAGDAVISVCMQDSLKGLAGKTPAASYVVAHDKRTGQPLWHTLRDTEADAEQCDSYTTPVFASSRSGEMIVMGGNELDAYDTGGKRIWSLPGLVGGRTITGPTVGGDMVYTTVGMRGPLYAIRLDRKPGGTPEDQIAWKHTDSTPDTCCPVVADGKVFIVADNGVASCLDAKSGKRHWRSRLSGDHFKASPITAGGNVYFLSHDGRCTVVKASDRYESVAQNKLDDDFTASPAVANGRIYLRGRKSLYAIGR